MDEILVFSSPFLSNDFHRQLIEVKNAVTAKEAPVERWKTALWEASSVEPAMLRGPFVILLFVFLWAANVFVFDRLHLQYHSVLNIRSGKLYIIYLCNTRLPLRSFCFRPHHGFHVQYTLHCNSNCSVQNV